MARFSNFTFDEAGVYIRNLANTADELGIRTYCFPDNYELAGKEFTVVCGDREFALSWPAPRHCTFNGTTCDTFVIKPEDDIYIARLGAVCAVLDLSNGQAALVIGDDVLPGVIKGVGTEAPAFAAEEMVETNVDWVMGVGRWLNQNFISAEKLASCWSPNAGEAQGSGYKPVDPTSKVQENPYKAVKFRDSFYLVVQEHKDCKEVCAPFATRKVVLLEDFERCMASGAVMGKGFDPIMVTGYARFAGQSKQDIL